MKFRPMLVGEMARSAETPRETVRVWLRGPLKALVEDRPKGWKRYSAIQVILVVLYASFVRATRDHEFAEVGMLLAAKILLDEMTQDEDGDIHFSGDTFTKDRFLIFWRDEKGEWEATMHETREGTHDAILQRLDHSYKAERTFTVVNFGAELSHAAASIGRVLGEADAVGPEEETDEPAA